MSEYHPNRIYLQAEEDGRRGWFPDRVNDDDVEYVRCSNEYKHLRLKLGKTQTEMAAEVGVHQGSWSRYELGLSTPTPKVTAKIIGCSERMDK